MNSEQIIETLRYPGKEVPREELAEIVRRREEFIPVLIAEIETATRLGADADLDNCLPSFALYLLAQLRETRALEPILAYFALDGTTEKDLFGDVITQCGARVLAAVAHDKPEALREYAKRKDLSPWVRAAALEALVRQALWGEQPRASVVRFFTELFEANEFGDDWEAWTWLVCSCMDLHPRKFLEDIRGLYERKLVDPSIVGDFDDIVKEAARDPEAHHRRQAEDHPPITDTSAEVSWWALFSKPAEPFADEGETDAPPIRPTIPVPRGLAVPIRNPPKVGRNDLCPCGSGKKYKKCCLVAGENRSSRPSRGT